MNDLRVTIRLAMNGGYSVDVTEGETLLSSRVLNLRPGETLTLHLTSPDSEPTADHR
jgi:hypothetical protein